MCFGVLHLSITHLAVTIIMLTLVIYFYILCLRVVCLYYFHYTVDLILFPLDIFTYVFQFYNYVLTSFFSFFILEHTSGYDNIS